MAFHKQAYPVIWACEIFSGSLLYYHFMKALRKRQWFHSAFNTEHDQHKNFDFVFLPVVILKQKYKPSSQFILKGDLVSAQSLMGNTVYTEIFRLPNTHTRLTLKVLLWQGNSQFHNFQQNQMGCIGSICKRKKCSQTSK